MSKFNTGPAKLSGEGSEVTQPPAQGVSSGTAGELGRHESGPCRAPHQGADSLMSAWSIKESSREARIQTQTRAAFPPRQSGTRMSDMKQNHRNGLAGE